MSAVVHLTGITHKFGDLKALDDVDFEVEQGTIHALVGENGAGKTTLMRVLFGALRPMSGTIIIRGNETQWRNSADAIAHHIGMVSQHYSVIPELTCLQNLILGSEGSFVIPDRESIQRADELAKRMGFKFEWQTLAAGISPSSAQKLEILKLLWRESEIMILDEPTAMLSPADSDKLFESLKQLSDSGATVIVVTHRLPEVLRHCQHVTVLRDGKRVADKPVAETDAHELAELIVGHSLNEHENPPFDPRDNVLDVKGLFVKGARGEDALKGIELQVREGEVVGLAGVDGNGQRELFQSLIGLLKIEGGRAVLDGQDLSLMKPSERIAAGLRLIPEDRHEDGFIEDWNLNENAALSLQRLAPFASGPWIDIRERERLAKKIADRFSTKHGGLASSMRSLSGGNQQRFIAARALELGPRIILAFQPTRGLDIAGTELVCDGLRSAARDGAGVLVVSFDLDELLENCDRVVAINHGRLFEPKSGDEHDRQAIGRLMVGAE